MSSHVPYHIPHELKEHRPKLVQLVIESRSLESEKAKQDRFDLSPNMTHAQLYKLEDILTREATKFAEIKAKYEDQPAK